MYSVKKSLLFILVIFSFCLMGENTFGQYPGMAAFRAQQTLQFANQQMQMMNLSWFRSSNLVYTYEVIMKDGSRKMVKSKIYNDTSIHKSYIVFIDKSVPRSDTVHRKMKIYPEQTRFIIAANEDNYVGRGVAIDSCWMFQVATGAINVYSFLSEESGTPDFNPATIIGIQLDKGPVEKYNVENLKKMIGSNLNAMEFFDHKDYYGAIIIFNKDAAEKARH